MNQGLADRMTLVGYAADGFPVYSNYGYAIAEDSKSGFKKMSSSWAVRSGTRPQEPDGPGDAFDGRFVADYEYVEGKGDLDAFNGRYGPTPEYPNAIYHYYITEQFPFVPRKFKGIPDSSFEIRDLAARGPGGGRDPGNRRGPPREGRLLSEID